MLRLDGIRHKRGNARSAQLRPHLSRRIDATAPSPRAKLSTEDTYLPKSRLLVCRDIGPWGAVSMSRCGCPQRAPPSSLQTHPSPGVISHRNGVHPHIARIPALSLLCARQRRRDPVDGVHRIGAKPHESSNWLSPKTRSQPRDRRADCRSHHAGSPSAPSSL